MTNTFSQLRYQYCAANKLRASVPQSSNAVKMYFSVPTIRPCMHHHNYGVISERHTCRDCMWPTILVARHYTTCRGERVLVVIRFNVTFLPFRPYCEKICTSFLNDTESLTMHGCALWRSQIAYVCSYSLNTTTVFYFVTEWPDVTVLGRLHATTHFYFTWPWPGLDSVSYSAVVLYQVLRVSEQQC